MLLGLFEPVDYVQEGIISGNIIGQEYAVRASVEDSSDAPEALLPCSVPDLELHYLVLDFDHE